MAGRVFPSATPRQAPPEFGEGGNVVALRRVALDDAESLKEIKVAGTALWAVAASSPGATLDLFIQDQYSGGFPVREGFFFRGLPFSRLFRSHAAQAGEWILFAVVVEKDPTTFEVLNPSREISTVDIDTPDTLDSLPDVTVAAGNTSVLLAANATRREALVQLDVAAPGACRVGDSGAGAANGLVLQPGDSIVLTTTDEIQAHNPNGSGADFALIEIEAT